MSAGIAFIVGGVLGAIFGMILGFLIKGDDDA